MISLCKIILISFSLILLTCIFSHEQTSLISDDQAIVIRKILKENGYNIANDEIVDKYLEFGSSSEHVNLNDNYRLLLPAKGQRILKVTADINSLDSQMFNGIKTYSYAKDVRLAEKYLVDSIAILADTIIRVKSFDISSNNVKSLPSHISLLRIGLLNLRDNKIDYLPSEITAISTFPILFDTIVVSIAYNKINTTILDPSILDWLNKYAEANWESTQKP